LLDAALIIDPGAEPHRQHGSQGRGAVGGRGRAAERDRVRADLRDGENVRVVGDRLYILIVGGDGDGEATMRLSGGDGPGMD
jgi:hypothetical protein